MKVIGAALDRVSGPITPSEIGHLATLAALRAAAVELTFITASDAPGPIGSTMVERSVPFTLRSAVPSLQLLAWDRLAALFEVNDDSPLVEPSDFCALTGTDEWMTQAVLDLQAMKLSFFADPDGPAGRYPERVYRYLFEILLDEDPADGPEGAVNTISGAAARAVVRNNGVNAFYDALLGRRVLYDDLGPGTYLERYLQFYFGS